MIQRVISATLMLAFWLAFVGLLWWDPKGYRSADDHHHEKIVCDCR